MEGKLNEFEKRIAEAKTLEAYISAYRYRIENDVNFFPFEAESIAAERMLAELEKFVPKLNLSRGEMDCSYNLLTSAILQGCAKIDEIRKGYAYLRTETNIEEGHLELQKKAAESNIEKIRVEREAYKNSLKILLERMECW